MVGTDTLDTYAAALDGTPLLGHLVLYSVFDGQVTPEALAAWFAEFGLDAAFLPGPLRAVDAFERVTGRDGARVKYPLDEQPAGRRRRGETDTAGRVATLMVRHVSRDRERITRHIVREVRDSGATRLSYDTRLGECTFDYAPGDGNGAGALHVDLDHAAVRALPTDEQARVAELLAEISAGYHGHCAYVSADKLRGVVRKYIEGLNAIRVRPTGGVYFVHNQHAQALAALRELVSRFGGKSHLSRIPLPDQAEMREMVVNAFATKAAEDLNRLAGEIAAARQAGEVNTAAVQALYRRFQALDASTAEHSRLLQVTLEDTGAALQLVKAQLGGLLLAASDDDDSPRPAGMTPVP